MRIVISCKTFHWGYFTVFNLEWGYLAVFNKIRSAGQKAYGYFTFQETGTCCGSNSELTKKYHYITNHFSGLMNV